MIVRILSAGVVGIEAASVDVEVDGARVPEGGNPFTVVVGLPDKSVNESKERVRAAVENSGYDFPFMRITVNLAPADMKKEGPAYDLPIAVGVMATNHQIDPNMVTRYAMVGELALDGRVRRISGALPIALALRE